MLLVSSRKSMHGPFLELNFIQLNNRQLLYLNKNKIHEHVCLTLNPSYTL